MKKVKRQLRVPTFKHNYNKDHQTLVWFMCNLDVQNKDYVVICDDVTPLHHPSEGKPKACREVRTNSTFSVDAGGVRMRKNVMQI